MSSWTRALFKMQTDLYRATVHELHAYAVNDIYHETKENNTNHGLDKIMLTAILNNPATSGIHTKSNLLFQLGNTNPHLI